jgi:hypothetical protein
MKKPKPGPKPEVLGLIPEVGQRFSPRKFFRDVLILPASLARYSGLSHGAKLMWGALNSYSALAEIYPATETLGQQIGVGLRMAQRYLDELEAEGFIFVDRTNLHFSKKKGGGGTPTYWFLWHPIFNTISTDISVSPDVSVSPDGFSKPPLTDMSPPTPDTSVTQTGLSREQVQKEQEPPPSVLDASVCKENDDEADYRFASAKTAEGSRDGRAGAAETAKTERQADPKADAPAKAAGGEENPPMRAKIQNPSVADDEDTPDPEEEIRHVLSDFHPAELEDWDGSGVPDWVCHATLNSAPDVSADVVCDFLRQKAAAGWQPRKWTSIPAMVRDAFAPRPKPAHVEPWTGLDVTNVQKWLRAFMDGEEPPLKLVSWIIDLAAEYSLRASDFHEALDVAWKRGAAPGQKNAPRRWNWFYEVLRAAFIPDYAARLPEAPATPHPAHHARAEEMARGIEALDSLVASYRCKCGAEIRQYTDRVEGTCTCGQAKPMSRAGTAQTPPPGKRRAAGGRQ